MGEPLDSEAAPGSPGPRREARRRFTDLLQQLGTRPPDERLVAELCGAARLAGYEKVAAAALEKALPRVVPLQRAAAHVRLARLYRRLGVIDRARLHLQRALCDAPLNVDGRMLLVALDDAQGYHDAAAEHLEDLEREAAREGQTRRAARLVRGRLQCLGRALGAAFEARAAAPQLEEALRRLLGACVQAGRPHEWTDALDALGGRAGAERASELVALAEAARARNALPEASAWFTAALAAEPSNTGLAARVESFFIARGAWSELASIYRVRAEHETDRERRADVLARLAELLEDELSQRTGAARVYGQIAEAAADPSALASQVRLLAAKGEPRAVDEALDRAAAMDRDPRVRLEALLLRGERQLAVGATAGAAESFEAAAAIDPRSVRGLAGLAEAKTSPDTVAAFEGAFKGVARGSSERAALARRLARLLEWKLVQPDRARPLWKEVLAEAPGDDEAERRLIAAARAHDDDAELVGLLRKRLSRRPRGPEARAARHELATCLERMGLPEEAFDEWRNAVRMEPGDAVALLALAERYEQHGRLQDAARALEEAAAATEIPAERAELWARLAKLVREQLHDEEAARQCEERARLIGGGGPGESAVAGATASAKETTLEEIPSPGGLFGPSSASVVASARVTAVDDGPFAARRLAVSSAAGGARGPARREEGGGLFGPSSSSAVASARITAVEDAPFAAGPLAAPGSTGPQSAGLAAVEEVPPPARPAGGAIPAAVPLRPTLPSDVSPPPRHELGSSASIASTSSTDLDEVPADEVVDAESAGVTALEELPWSTPPGTGAAALLSQPPAAGRSAAAAPRAAGTFHGRAPQADARRAGPASGDSRPPPLPKRPRIPSGPNIQVDERLLSGEPIIPESMEALTPHEPPVDPDAPEALTPVEPPMAPESSGSRSQAEAVARGSSAGGLATSWRRARPGGAAGDGEPSVSVSRELTTPPAVSSPSLRVTRPRGPERRQGPDVERLLRELEDQPLEPQLFHEIAERMEDPGRGVLMEEIARALEGDPHAAPRAPRLVLGQAEWLQVRHPDLQGPLLDLLAASGELLCAVDAVESRRSGTRRPFVADESRGAKAVDDAVVCAERCLAVRAPETFVAELDHPPLRAVNTDPPRLLVGKAAIGKILPEAQLRFFAGRVLCAFHREMLSLRLLGAARLRALLAALGQVVHGGRPRGPDAEALEERLHGPLRERLSILYERGMADLGALPLLDDGARHTANRAGLLVAGGVAPVVSALKAKRGGTEELVELVRFAASDVYLTLRSRR